MTDPCYLMMLSKNLGPNYKVIDKAASIDFLQPGMGPVSAHCQLTQQDIDEIINATANGNRYLKTFEIDIINDNDTLIAKVSRVVYIRKKPH